jgi:hypothetical protein
MTGLKPSNKNALRRALQGNEERFEEIRTNVLDLQNQAEYVDEISRLWRESQQRFLAIGRYLIQAKSRLPHGEFEEMVRTKLPFGVGVAYQLRAVAEAIDTGRVCEDELPPSYSIVYRVVKFTNYELEIARQRSLIRPNVTRREIEEFAQSIRKPIAPTGDSRSALRQRHAQLLAQKARLLEEIRKIEEELAGEIIDGSQRVARI